MVGYAQQIHDQTQGALVLVESDRLELGPYVRAYQHCCHLPSAVGCVGGNTFIPSNDQHAVGKGRAREQRLDVGLQPVVGVRQLVRVLAAGSVVRTVVRVVLEIGNDESKGGQRPGSQIGGQLAEGNDLIPLRAGVQNVSEVDKGIVMLYVGHDIAA